VEGWPPILSQENLMGRTNIVISDDLIRQARKLTGLKTKREIVEKALELLVRSNQRKGILRNPFAAVPGVNSLS